MDDYNIPDQLRYCEALRYVEDSTLARLYLGAKMVNIASEPESGLGNSTGSSETFKVVNSGGFLNSTSQLLAAVLGTDAAGHEPYTNIAGAQVAFRTSTAATLCVVPLNDPEDKLVSEDVLGPVVQALMKKIYFVAFRYAQSHFSPHNETSSDLSGPVNAFTSMSQPPDRSQHSAPRLQVANISNESRRIHETGLANADPKPDSAHPLDVPNLGLVPHRCRSFLRLQTVATLKPVSDDTTVNNFFCFSSSAISHTERKEKVFLLHSLDEPDDILAKKTYVAQTLCRLLDLDSSDLTDHGNASSVISDTISNVKILSFEVNASSAHENERYPGFFVVVRGQIDALYSSGERSKENEKDLSTDVSLTLTDHTVNVLPPILSLTDFALDWSTFNPGQEIYRKGDPSDSIFFVFRGRVRTIEDIPGGDEKRVKEAGPGNSFGALDVYTRNRRQGAALATRRSEIGPGYYSRRQITACGCSIWAVQNHCRLTSAEVPVDRFVSLLSIALVNVGIYSSDEIMKVRSELMIDSIGKSVFSNAGNIQVEDYLAHLQENIELSILIVDHSVDSTWGDICIANADCIILVGLDDSDPTVGPVEMRFEKPGSMTQKMLVLIESDEDTPDPTPVTKSWIGIREGSPIMRVRTSKIFATKTLSDYFWTWRRQGFAHLGAIKAFEEEGIPIDIIGGTSMGAFVEALGQALSEKSRWWHYLSDTTPPVLAATSGAHVSNMVAAAIGERLASSHPRPTFYCNATNISNGCQSHIMYPQGKSLWQMVRASMGVPGVFPPFAMDNHGDLLVDGCFSANVPVFPALALGAEVVFAFDVSEKPAPPAQSLTPSVSGWRLAMQLLFQCCRHRRRTESNRHDQTATSETDILTYTNKGGTLTLPRIINLLSFSTNMNELRAIKETPECFITNLLLGILGHLPWVGLMRRKSLGIGMQNFGSGN
ncbi:hypothetical protein EDB80DRAFT_690317 [Ilyonectria destructans]|nr:hypothetical protein EDB80DRAFT_690317 [Ilyonectria destructans]